MLTSISLTVFTIYSKATDNLKIIASVKIKIIITAYTHIMLYQELLLLLLLSLLFFRLHIFI